MLINVLLVLTLAANTVQQDKAKVPSASEQRVARTQVRDAFKEAYATGGPTLIDKLLQAAEEAQAPIITYVLLVEARDFAVIQLDMKKALNALLQITRKYDVDDIAMLDKMLAQSKRMVRTPQQLEMFLKGVIELAKVGVESRVKAPSALTGAIVLTEHPAEWGIRALKAAEKAAKRSRNLSTILQIRNFISQLEVKRDAELAASILAYKEDPQARRLLGLYLCFTEGDWRAGCQHLAKGDDATLALLAQMELVVEGDAISSGSLGDAWLDASKKRKREGVQYRRRALYWYRKAAKDAPVLEKGKWRSQTLEAIRLPGGRLDLLEIVDLTMARDPWRLAEGALSNDPVLSGSGSWIVIPYAPPLEYDLEFKAERVKGARYLQVGFLGSGRRLQVTLDGTFDFSGIDGIDGKGARENETARKGKFFPLGKPQQVRCSVRNSSVAVTVGSKKIINWKADWSRLSFDGAPHERAIYFRTLWTVWRISEIRVRPIKGNGDILK